MIRIKISAEPIVLDLPEGVRLTCRPPGSSVIVAAGADLGEDRGRAAFARAVARAAIIGWEGVEDGDGEPLEVSPEAVDALMEVWPIFAAFERLYVQPALVVNTEGNA